MVSEVGRRRLLGVAVVVSVVSGVLSGFALLGALVVLTWPAATAWMRALRPASTALLALLVLDGALALGVSIRSVYLALACRARSAPRKVRLLHPVSAHLACLLLPSVILNVAVVLWCVLGMALSPRLSRTRILWAALGYTEDSEARDAMDSAQTGLQCCGYDGASDWHAWSNDPLGQLKSEGQGRHAAPGQTVVEVRPHNRDIPDSCCSENGLPSDLDLDLDSLPGSNPSACRPWDNGCFRVLTSALLLLHLTVGGASFLMAAVLVVGLRLAQTSARLALESGDPSAPAPAWLFRPPRPPTDATPTSTSDLRGQEQDRRWRGKGKPTPGDDEDDDGDASDTDDPDRMHFQERRVRHTWASSSSTQSSFTMELTETPIPTSEERFILAQYSYSLPASSISGERGRSWSRSDSNSTLSDQMPVASNQSEKSWSKAEVGPVGDCEVQASTHQHLAKDDRAQVQGNQERATKDIIWSWIPDMSGDALVMSLNRWQEKTGSAPPFNTNIELQTLACPSGKLATQGQHSALHGPPHISEEGVNSATSMPWTTKTLLIGKRDAVAGSRNPSHIESCSKKSIPRLEELFREHGVSGPWRTFSSLDPTQSLRLRSAILWDECETVFGKKDDIETVFVKQDDRETMHVKQDDGDDSVSEPSLPDLPLQTTTDVLQGVAECIYASGNVGKMEDESCSLRETLSPESGIDLDVIELPLPPVPSRHSAQVWANNINHPIRSQGDDANESHPSAERHSSNISVDSTECGKEGLEKATGSVLQHSRRHGSSQDDVSEEESPWVGRLPVRRTQTGCMQTRTKRRKQKFTSDGEITSWLRGSERWLSHWTPDHRRKGRTQGRMPVKKLSSSSASPRSSESYQPCPGPEPIARRPLPIQTSTHQELAVVPYAYERIKPFAEADAPCTCSMTGTGACWNVTIHSTSSAVIIAYVQHKRCTLVKISLAGLGDALAECHFIHAPTFPTQPTHHHGTSPFELPAQSRSKAISFSEWMSNVKFKVMEGLPDERRLSLPAGGNLFTPVVQGFVYTVNKNGGDCTPINDARELVARRPSKMRHQLPQVEPRGMVLRRSRRKNSNMSRAWREILREGNMVIFLWKAKQARAGIASETFPGLSSVARTVGDVHSAPAVCAAIEHDSGLEETRPIPDRMRIHPHWSTTQLTLDRRKESIPPPEQSFEPAAHAHRTYRLRHSPAEMSLSQSSFQCEHCDCWKRNDADEADAFSSTPSSNDSYGCPFCEHGQHEEDVRNSERSRRAYSTISDSIVMLRSKRTLSGSSDSDTRAPCVACREEQTRHSTAILSKVNMSENLNRKWSAASDGLPHRILVRAPSHFEEREASSDSERSSLPEPAASAVRLLATNIS